MSAPWDWEGGYFVSNNKLCTDRMLHRAGLIGTTCVLRDCLQSARAICVSAAPGGPGAGDCVPVGLAAFLARAEPHADTVRTAPWPFHVALATLQGRGPPWRADILEGAWLNPVPDKSRTWGEELGKRHSWCGHGEVGVLTHHWWWCRTVQLPRIQ